MGSSKEKTEFVNSPKYFDSTLSISGVTEIWFEINTTKNWNLFLLMKMKLQENKKRRVMAIYLMVHNDNKESNNYVHSILDIHYVDMYLLLLPYSTHSVALPLMDNSTNFENRNEQSVWWVYMHNVS